MLTEEQIKSIKQQLKEQVENLPEEQKEGLIGQIDNATSEQLEVFIKQQGSQSSEGSESPSESSGEECLFCGIAKGSIDTIKVYEDNFVTAFLDITPSAPGQTIVIPKEHYQFIFQLPDHILWSLIKTVKMLMPLIVNVTKAEGISVYAPQGPEAGQRIGHVAFNLIPRFSGDKAVFAWERKEAPRAELEKIAKEIKKSADKSLEEEKAKIKSRILDETLRNQKLSEKPEEMPRRSLRGYQ